MNETLALGAVRTVHGLLLRGADTLMEPSVNIPSEFVYPLQ